MSVNEELSCELYNVTTENIVKKIRSTYDPDKESITNEVSSGLCSSCGKALDEKNVVRCCYGDLLCNGCTIRYKGHSLCRNDVEVNVGTKNEAFVLLCICLGFDRSKTKRLSRLSDDSLSESLRMLEDREYVTKKTLGLVGGRVKPTEAGLDVIGILVETYKADYDFRGFLQKLGWDANVGPRSEQK